MENKLKKVFLDGIDGTGKTTAIKTLKEKCPEFNFVDRGILTKLTLKHWEDWPKPSELDRDWEHYIIFEVEIQESRRRLLNRQETENIPIDKFESERNLFLFRYRYRTLAAYYGNIHVVDTTNKSREELVNIVTSIIKNNCIEFLVPCIEEFSSQNFELLPLVIQGESKIVRAFNSRFDIVKYKPTVYSHKMQRAGEVKGTDIERMSMTKNLLDIFSRHNIQHTYWHVGPKFILNEKLDNSKDIPPIETIVKRCFVGSDKHRYYGLNNLTNRFGKKVVKSELNEYQKLLVRFDYRNPNFHPETGLPLGDILLCDDLADEFINTNVAKQSALNVFRCLDFHFSKMNIYFEDVCLMFTTSGDKLYGEVSQDCGRYKYVFENQLSDLDKDVWRAGGSSELVLQKYQMISSLVKNYVKNVLYEDEDKKDFA
jgi:phosphoribosylaminoimidazole-succinocarboxamide synthase